MAVPLPTRAVVLPRAGSVAALGARADVLLVGALVGLAFAVRWPSLLLSPQFPSIGGTVLQALDVADGRALPLFDQAPYLGPLLVYLLAGVFKLFGPSVEAPLLLAWAIGSLTTVPTYLLGRELGGRSVGLLAGALLATSGAHTVITSHVPLVHSMTPLLATTTLWLLVRAVSRVEPDDTPGRRVATPATSGMARRLPRLPTTGAGRLLAASGLLAGLSLQSHPTVAPLLGGAALASLLCRPAWLRTRWPYLAVVGVVLGYSVLLAHHLQTRFVVVDDVRDKQARYLDADDDAGENAERGIYLNNLEQLAISAARLASGAIDQRQEVADYLRDPWVLVYPAFALAGLAVAARRGNPVLLLALLPAILLPPLFSGKYRPILDGRYLMPLVPVLFVGVGLALAALARVLQARGATSRWQAMSWTAFLPLGVLAMLLVLHPLWLLADFYEESQEDGFSNAMYLQTHDQIRAAELGGELVVLDDRLGEVKSAGGGNARSNFAWLLAVSRIPAGTWDAAGDDPAALVGHVAILHRTTADRLTDRLSLAPLDGRRPNGRDRPSYRAYRVAAPEASR